MRRLLKMSIIYKIKESWITISRMQTRLANDLTVFRILIIIYPYLSLHMWRLMRETCHVRFLLIIFCRLSKLQRFFSYSSTERLVRFGTTFLEYRQILVHFKRAMQKAITSSRSITFYVPLYRNSSMVYSLNQQYWVLSNKQYSLSGIQNIRT